MKRQEWEQLFRKLQKQEFELACKKNNDYSSEDDPFENFRSFGELGILVRMSDKLSRLKQFLKNGKLSVTDESAIDTCMDLSNYANLLIGYLTDKQKQ